MKKAAQILLMSTLLTIFTIGTAFSDEGLESIQSEKSIAYGHIDNHGLRALMDARVSHVLIDARGDKWHDGTMIPGATLASYELSQEELEQLFPNKQDLTVVYCFSARCPLARYLIDKLVSFGYKNVVEYAGGIEEWKDAEYLLVPVEG